MDQSTGAPLLLSKQSTKPRSTSLLPRIDRLETLNGSDALILVDQNLTKVKCLLALL